MLCVPVWDNVVPGKACTFSYLSVPLGYRMWQKEKATKLALAVDMVRLARGFANLDIICGARADAALYGLPPA